MEATYASESAAAIITMVFQHTDNGCKYRTIQNKEKMSKIRYFFFQNSHKVFWVGILS